MGDRWDGPSTARKSVWTLLWEGNENVIFNYNYYLHHNLIFIVFTSPSILNTDESDVINRSNRYWVSQTYHFHEEWRNSKHQHQDENTRKKEWNSGEIEQLSNSAVEKQVRRFGEEIRKTKINPTARIEKVRGGGVKTEGWNFEAEVVRKRIPKKLKANWKIVQSPALLARFVSKRIKIKKSPAQKIVRVPAQAIQPQVNYFSSLSQLSLRDSPLLSNKTKLS